MSDFGKATVVYSAALTSLIRWTWRSRVASALAAFIVVGVHVMLPSSGAAQVIGGPRPAPTSESQLGVLTRFDAHASGQRISGDGESQFNWDTDIGVDMDIFDLDLLRGNVFINVETIVGDERRAIDPNQNNYTFDLSVFTRLPRGEIGTTFHHVSRHQSDREQLGSPAWNMLGLTYGDRYTYASLNFEMVGRWLRVIEGSEVDYEQEVDTSIRISRPMSERIALFGRFDGSMVTVYQKLFGRSTQYGGRVEGGVRIEGGIGAVELLVGRERRIDADFFARRPIRWTELGFRFVLD